MGSEMCIRDSTLSTCRALSAATAPSSCSSPDAPWTPNRQRRWASSIASCRMPNRKRGRSGSPANWRQNPKRRCARGAPPDVGLREGNGLSQFHRVNHARRIIDLAGKLAAIVGKRSNPKIFDAPPSRTATLREKPSVPGFGAAATLRKSASVDCALRMAAPWRDRYRPHWRFHRAPPSLIRFGQRAGRCEKTDKNDERCLSGEYRCHLCLVVPQIHIGDPSKNLAECGFIPLKDAVRA